MGMTLLKSALLGASLLEAVVCACLVAELAAYRLRPVFLRHRLLLLSSTQVLQQIIALRASLSFDAEAGAATGTSAAPDVARHSILYTTQNARSGFKAVNESLPEAHAEPGFS